MESAFNQPRRVTTLSLTQAFGLQGFSLKRRNNEKICGVVGKPNLETTRRVGFLQVFLQALCIEFAMVVLCTPGGHSTIIEIQFNYRILFECVSV